MTLLFIAKFLPRFYNYRNIKFSLINPKRFLSLNMSSINLKQDDEKDISSKANIVYNEDDFMKIEEGTASMLYDKNEPVFYNKVQVLNRDLSIQVIRLFAEIRDKERKEKYAAKMERYEIALENEKTKLINIGSKPQEPLKLPYPPKEGISILDALSATGLRSVRYLKEIPGVNNVTINDLDPLATAAARNNCKNNNIENDKVTFNTGNAVSLMYDASIDLDKHFDVIDLDPYGTACPFIDSAVQAVSDGGLMCVTCTDMTVLAGSYPDVCFAKYGSVPLRTRYCHEMSLRILLHALESSANKYKRHIVPWISMSIDYYVRVFVRVYESPQEVKKSSLKRIMAFQSTQCSSFYLQQMGKVQSFTKDNKPAGFVASHFDVPSVCEETGGKFRMGGPFWGEAIHDQTIVDTILTRLESADPITGISPSLPYPVPSSYRVKALLTAMSEELKDVPFYYTLPDLASTCRSKVPTTLEFKSALHNKGYRFSQFHHEAAAVKTDAPPKVIWDIMRSFCKLNPPEGSKHKKLSDASAKILEKVMLDSEVADFTVPEEFLNVPKKNPRFPPNPESGWGPKRKAGKLIKDQLLEDKMNINNVDDDDDNNNKSILKENNKSSKININNNSNKNNREKRMKKNLDEK